jgi:hypothetical protein
MRTVEWLQVLGATAAALASAVMAIEQRLIRDLERRGADSPSGAVEPPRLRRLSRWRLARLEKHGAVRGAGGATIYLDREAYRDLRRVRRRRAVAAVLASLVLVTVLYQLSR